MTKGHNVRVESRTPQDGAPAATRRLSSRSSNAPGGFHPTWVPTESSHPTNPQSRPALSLSQSTQRRGVPIPLVGMARCAVRAGSRRNFVRVHVADNLFRLRSNAPTRFLPFRTPHSSFRTRSGLPPLGEGDWSPCRSSAPSAATSRSPLPALLLLPQGEGRNEKRNAHPVSTRNTQYATRRTLAQL